MDRRHRITGSAAAAAILAAALTGSTVGAQGGKEGGSVPPVALELAVAEWAGSGLVDVFAAKVDELSEGQMRIDIDWEGGSEQEVPSRVQAGEADLGWVFARGLNAAGVHDLDALITPFLVSDRRLLDEVITGPIGDDMIAGLADDGLEGLALLPGGQRFFVGIGHALASPADFVGARIGLVRTPFLDRLVASLGAEPVAFGDDVPAAYEAQGIDGIITVADNLAMFPDTVMTSNLVPYTVPTIVLANAEVMDELTPEQQAILREAAIDVRDQLLSEMPDVESSAVRCGIGASVIEATDADVSAIQSATQPVRDSLAEDLATAAFIERIETLKAELPAPSWPATCDAPSLPDATLTGIPDGTYTTQLTKDDAVRLGVEDPCTLNGSVMTVTLVLDGGSFTELQTCGDGPTEPGSQGIYVPEGEKVVFSEPGYPGETTFAWSFDDGTLTLSTAETDHVDAIVRYLFENEFELAAS